MNPPIFDPDILDNREDKPNMYRIEYGPPADERLRDRLDRMVAAVYPFVHRQTAEFPGNLALDGAVELVVPLAWSLLKAVDASIERKTATREKEPTPEPPSETPGLDAKDP